MSLSTYTQMRAFVKKARKDNDNYLIMQVIPDLIGDLKQPAVTFGLVPEVSNNLPLSVDTPHTDT